MTKPRLLGGRYELDGIVGRGGMAEVFRARDIRLDRIVAVKTLRKELAGDETLQTRFRREAQSAATLNHPSIVAVYDTGEDMAVGGPVPYIVMEFVNGRTLRDLLREGRQLLPERALEITDGVLRALDHSHRHGIVHRDIKPGNVMLTRTGHPKVMDFGIARAVSGAELTITRTAQVIGTAHYLSPEQARGERVDARSDLYSTGCLLYELVTGRPPFTGESPVAIAYQHVKEDPVPPSRVDAEVPKWADGMDPEMLAWCDAIVLKAMQKDPARRYQSAAEMRDDIQRALAGAPVAAPHRKPWPWATLAVVIVVLSLALLGITFLRSTSNEVGVPRVAGMSLAHAESAITGADLRVGKISYTSSVSVAKNYVIASSPSHGTLVSKGDAVNLIVSKGLVPVASHPRSKQSPSRHSPSAGPPQSPGTSSTDARSPSPSPTAQRPRPSASCVVDILGVCV